MDRDDRDDSATLRPHGDPAPGRDGPRGRRALQGGYPALASAEIYDPRIMLASTPESHSMVVLDLTLQAWKARHVGLGKASRQGSAPALLGDWRVAERDTVAARSAASVADLALKAAAAAEEVARECEAAAKAASDAAQRAMDAADRARKIALQLSEAAQLAAVTAKGDKVRANRAVEKAEEAESHARDRFHSAEEVGFPKD